MYKAKSYGIEMSEDILAYKLLKSANLSNEQKQKKIIKATLAELQYDSIKNQLKETLNDSSWHIPLKEKGLMKTENTLLAAAFDNLQLTYFYQDNAPNTTEYYPYRE